MSSRHRQSQQQQSGSALSGHVASRAGSSYNLQQYLADRQAAELLPPIPPAPFSTDVMARTARALSKGGGSPLAPSWSLTEVQSPTIAMRMRRLKRPVHVFDSQDGDDESYVPSPQQLAALQVSSASLQSQPPHPPQSPIMSAASVASGSRGAQQPQQGQLRRRGSFDVTSRTNTSSPRESNLNGSTHVNAAAVANFSFTTLSASQAADYQRYHQGALTSPRRRRHLFGRDFDVEAELPRWDVLLGDALYNKEREARALLQAKYTAQQQSQNAPQADQDQQQQQQHQRRSRRSRGANTSSKQQQQQQRNSSTIGANAGVLDEATLAALRLQELGLGSAEELLRKRGVAPPLATESSVLVQSPTLPSAKTPKKKRPQRRTCFGHRGAAHVATTLRAGVVQRASPPGSPRTATASDAPDDSGTDAESPTQEEGEEPPAAAVVDEGDEKVRDL